MLDALYGHRQENWNEIFNDDFDFLLTKDKDYWLNLMKVAFGGKRVLVKGVPSIEQRYAEEKGKS